jgi:hypothetical protein
MTETGTLTLRSFIADLKNAARKYPDAMDAPLWINCGDWVSCHEIDVDRPVYAEGGARTEVHITIASPEKD